MYAWNFFFEGLTRLLCVRDDTELEITIYKVIYSGPNMVLLIFSFYNENLVYLFPIQLRSSTKTCEMLPHLKELCGSKMWNRTGKWLIKRISLLDFYSLFIYVSKIKDLICNIYWHYAISIKSYKLLHVSYAYHWYLLRNAWLWKCVCHVKTRYLDHQ